MPPPFALSIAREYGHQFAAYRNDEKQPNETQPAREEAEAHAPGEGRVEMIDHPNRAETPKTISITRCPGGKSKLPKHIVPLIWLEDSPRNTHFEPFVGSGSVALTVAQRWPAARLILNDRDANIYSF